MKKVFVIALCAVTMMASCGKSKKEEAKRKAEMEKIQQEMEEARRADEERMRQLQEQARQDSITMALAMETMQAQSSSGAKSYSSYYVVVGSFLEPDNADAYLEEMAEIFDEVEIVRNGKWSMVTVGGAFRSFNAAAATIEDVEAELGGGGEEDDEEYYDEYDEYGSGLAWVMGM